MRWRWPNKKSFALNFPKNKKKSMDFQGNPQPESGKLEQIISQFLLKSLHVICDSRIPSLRPQDRTGTETSSSSRVRKSDKWFNLVLGDRPTALENLNYWHRNLMDPMIIDIILVHDGPSSSSVDNLFNASTASTSVETVIERWVVQYESPRIVAPQTGAELSASFKKTYKKSIILLRALYSHMRLLPAYRIFRQLNSSTQTYNFDIIHRVSSSGDPFARSAPDPRLEEYSFPPVEAFPGKLSVSVSYRSSLSEFNLEPSSAIPPKIISDYVGSPATDPMRSFPNSEKGVRSTSFPLSGPRPPPPSSSSSPFDRPHSWTSGFHRPAAAPKYRHSPTPSDFPFSSSPVDSRAQSYNRMLISNQRGSGGGGYDEYQLSPPFSPSPSPSPPAYFYGGRSSDTAPVTIPASMVAGRSSRYLSPNFSDPSRNPLPPMSPRGTRNDLSSHESPSGIRSFRRIEPPPRAGEYPSGITNHHTGQKLIRDGKDDSGRFSGPLSSSGSPRVGFSRSSSRLSFQDDLDDLGFSCPFDVDDVDPTDFQASQSLPSKRATESNPLGRKSQDAAVGVLVHMLRTAPPLRQDSSCYSAEALRADPDGGLSTASSFFVPRKASDALEELRSYREMKDLLLSKSGIGVVGKEEA